MTSMPFFNSKWRNAYIRAATKDVYIPCASYADHFFRILRRESKFYDKETQARHEARCRTITFAVSSPRASQQRSTTSHPASITMAEILRFISNDQFSYVPNMRKIAIHYHNVGFDDIFEHSRLVYFPSQVTELEIVHTFSPEMPEFSLSELRDEHEENECPRCLSDVWCMPNIRHLTLAGVGDCYTAKMVTVCPNIVNLELDLSYGPLREIYIRAPNSLQRLILHSSADVEPPQEVLSPASAHIERLPSVHHPAREMCLIPTNRDEYHYSTTKWSSDDVYLLEFYYPADFGKTHTWMRWYPW